jgi:putative NADPH-quinone reductase
MNKTLAIIGHPNLNQGSLANKIIVDRLHAQDGVEVRDLGQLYPDFQIDIEAEQQALLEADTIVLQFPLYWYSVPAILKHWFDQVLTYGFAYGSSGDKLRGKRLILSFTIGGPEEAYQPGADNHTIEALLPPLKQTAIFTGMEVAESIYSYGMMLFPGVNSTEESIKAKAHEHAERLLAAVEAVVQVG